jgi:hypothetical protein
MEGRKRRPTLFGSLLVLGCALALGVAPSAQAANIAPNPGFEDVCGAGIPCHWFGSGGSFPSSDTNNPHSGLRSFRITSTQAQSSTTAVSDCISVTAGTTYNLVLFYRTSSARVTQILFAPLYWSNANCTGSNLAPAGASTNSASHDGNWHSISGTSTAPTNPPFNALSAQLLIHFGCSSGCQANDAANYDDAVVDSSPLAATVTAFSAKRSAKGIVLRWRTGTEADTLGFNVYRQSHGKRVRVNRRLLPALGAVAGSSYSFLDRRAPRRAAVRYWLQDVDVSGARTWYGPVRARAA